ncbi:DUF726 domain-containing protein [Crocosphaera sp. XPORK-15E]|uniref:DUF726 domain-containing protein n=1 Tax=Crocosphaera sp. XPORK-15E TaxID=3110247 RepID=UPI002B20E30F|nr:DUF726 domain-containing protein [Crocosphaera sp. XPORK-15E]MEA5536527.1 DUF726 domain-containing protein [Crocosphaera sp. XPORK-15E]
MLFLQKIIGTYAMQKPYIKLIQANKGRNEALIFVNGYQMKDNENSKLWSSYLRRANWKGSIYQLWWDSGSEYGRKYSMSPLGKIPILNELVHSYPHWRMVLKRAKISGSKYLPSLLLSIPENEVSFIGYSLGCRLIHYGLQEFDSRLSLTSLKNIILLAGAIRTIRWEKIAINITGKIYNLYNRDDDVLNYLFTHFGAYPYKPCGVKKIKTQCQNIENIDITQLINTKSHDLELYLKVLTKFFF